MDEKIRRAAFFKLYSQSLLSRYALSAIPSIHIIVKNGNLTLEGVVDSEADRTVAELRVNQASNVFSVTNNLRVEQAQEASK
jgi:hyperosmotically inducible protein